MLAITTTIRKVSMKKIILISTMCLSPLVSSFAQDVQFITTPLQAKNPEKVSGTLPFIQGKGFEKYNQNIHQEIAKKFDQPDWWISMEAKKIYQDANYLSYEMNYDISDFTTRHKSFHYTIDLKNKKNITLMQYLKHQHLSVEKIQNALIKFVKYCDQNTIDETCADPTLNNVSWGIDDYDFIFDLSKNPNFYLKKDIIGIGFEGSKYTYAFEYNLKTHQVQ